MPRKPLSRVESQETEADPEHNVTPGHAPDSEHPSETDKPTVRLVGEDGNGFAIIGRCQRAALAAGWSKERWAAVRDQMMSGDYDDLLAAAQEHFDVH